MAQLPNEIIEYISDFADPITKIRLSMISIDYYYISAEVRNYMQKNESKRLEAKLHIWLHKYKFKHKPGLCSRCCLEEVEIGNTHICGMCNMYKQDSQHNVYYRTLYEYLWRFGKISKRQIIRELENALFFELLVIHANKHYLINVSSQKYYYILRKIASKCTKQQIQLVVKNSKDKFIYESLSDMI